MGRKGPGMCAMPNCTPGIDGVYGKVYEIVRIDEVNEAVHVAGKSV